MKRCEHGTPIYEQCNYCRIAELEAQLVRAHRGPTMKGLLVSYQGEDTTHVGVFFDPSEEETKLGDVFDVIEGNILVDIQKWACPPEGEFELRYEQQEHVTYVFIDDEEGMCENDAYIISTVEINSI